MFWANFVSLARVHIRCGLHTRDLEQYFWQTMPIEQYKQEYNKYLDFQDRDPEEWQRYA